MHSPHVQEGCQAVEKAVFNPQYPPTLPFDCYHGHVFWKGMLDKQQILVRTLKMSRTTVR